MGAVSGELAFIWQDDLTDDERALIERLEVEFGDGKRLLGTDRPPPAFARRVSTPEEAAEILGIDLVLIERRINAGILPYRETEGKITFNFFHVLEAMPDFGYAGWFSMLFAAGMGIGPMFFGVLEPMYHFSNPPLGIASPMLVGVVNAETVEAAREAAMAATIYHWGLHPWAIYAVVGLSLALAAYNKGIPMSVRSAFYPIFGERVRGWIGHIIDIMAVFATLFGLATSLGFGAEQALAGFNFLYGVPVTDTMKVLLITGITAIALVSVVAGLDAGVKRPLPGSRP